MELPGPPKNSNAHDVSKTASAITVTVMVTGPGVVNASVIIIFTVKFMA